LSRISVCLSICYLSYEFDARLRFEKIVGTCIYSPDLKNIKDFYVNSLGLDLVSEEEGRHVFLKAGKSMLLIFNSQNTRLAANQLMVRLLLFIHPFCSGNRERGL
jgi:hypothetical protein